MKKIIFLLCIFSVSLLSQYHSYKELTDNLKKISEASSIVKLRSIAKTLKERDVWAVTIGKEENNKALLVVGGIEAAQVVGTEHALRLINFLATSYGKVDSITALLNSTTIYVIPRINPDASEAYFEKPLRERETNYTPFDDDRDGQTDEDDVDDVNKDGTITLMRVKDSQGEWIENPNDRRLMKKADASKGEKGMYKIYSEGFDNDNDEQWNEDALGGTDLNHNFPHLYKYFSRNSGMYQVSEPESRALADFLFDHQTIAMVFTFSSNDNVTTAWKNEPPRGESRFITSVDKSDEEYFDYVSKKFGEITKLKNAPKPERGEGSFSETAYYQAGRWSFAVRPWWAGEIHKQKDTLASKESEKKSFEMKKPGKENSEDADEKILQWYDAAGIKDIAVEWKKVTQPDLPDKEVEIGGVKPFILSNPPADSLDSYAKPYSNFITFLAQQLPSLSLSKPLIEKLGSNVFRITLDVVNNGYLPTISALGEKTRWVRNVKVFVDAGKNTITVGKTKQVVNAISGSGGYKTLSWVIVGKGNIKITAESPMCGSADITLTLK